MLLHALMSVRYVSVCAACCLHHYTCQPLIIVCMFLTDVIIIAESTQVVVFMPV